MATARKRHFAVYFDAHASAPKVWTVRVGRTSRNAEFVIFDGVNCWTRYKGPRARQPKATLCGFGHVIFRRNGTAVIR